MSKKISKFIKDRPKEELKGFELVISPVYLGDGKDKILVKQIAIHILDKKTQKYAALFITVKKDSRLDQELEKLLEVANKEINK